MSSKNKYVAPNDLVEVKGTDGPRANIPRLMFFEGKGNIARRWSWDYRGFRPAREGEWFVSGAKPQAYRAKSDGTTPYHIVVPRLAYMPTSVYALEDPQP